MKSRVDEVRVPIPDTLSTSSFLDLSSTLIAETRKFHRYRYLQNPFPSYLPLSPLPRLHLKNHPLFASAPDLDTITSTRGEEAIYSLVLLQRATTTFPPAHAAIYINRVDDTSKLQPSYTVYTNSPSRTS